MSSDVNAVSGEIAVPIDINRAECDRSLYSESQSENFAISTNNTTLREAVLHKMRAEVAYQPNFIKLENKPKNDANNKSTKLIDAIRKYSNPLSLPKDCLGRYLDAPSHAIYARDYEAALIMIEQGLQPSGANVSLVRQNGNAFDIHLSPIDLLLIDEIKSGNGRDLGGVLRFRVSIEQRSTDKGKLTYRSLRDLDDKEIPHVGVSCSTPNKVKFN